MKVQLILSKADDPIQQGIKGVAQYKKGISLLCALLTMRASVVILLACALMAIAKATPPQPSELGKPVTKER